MFTFFFSLGKAKKEKKYANRQTQSLTALTTEEKNKQTSQKKGKKSRYAVSRYAVTRYAVTRFTNNRRLALVTSLGISFPRKF